MIERPRPTPGRPETGATWARSRPRPAGTTTLPTMETHPNTPAHPGGPAVAPPGDLAIWFFILAELLAFGVFFAAYAFTRANNIELFNAEQAGLSPGGGSDGPATTISGPPRAAASSA